MNLHTVVNYKHEQWWLIICERGLTQVNLLMILNLNLEYVVALYIKKQ